MWQASCALLGSALSKSLWVVHWIKMVNFKLRNEKWKVNWATWHERGKKKNLSPAIWEGGPSPAFGRPSHLPCTLTSKTCLQFRYNILKGRTRSVEAVVVVEIVGNGHASKNKSHSNPQHRWLAVHLRITKQVGRAVTVQLNEKFSVSFNSLRSLLIACPKEFFNVSWVGTFEGEHTIQDCPRGAAGKSSEQPYGKVCIEQRVTKVSHAAGGHLSFP